MDYCIFEKKKKIPKNFIEQKFSNEVIDQYYCGQRTIRSKSVPQINHPGSKVYLTHDNGGRPFAVYLNSKQIRVYKIPENSVILEENIIKDKYPIWAYHQLIYESDLIKSWVAEGYTADGENPIFC